MNKQQQNKTPLLRFPEFKEEWEVKRLGEIGKIIGGGTPVSSNTLYWKGVIPWISSSDVIEDNVQDIKITRFITEDAITNSATKIIPKNSILIVSRVGVGKFAVSKKVLCTSQDFSNLVLNKDNSFFLAYYFIARKNKFLSLSQGTSIKGFTGKDIRNLKFVIPNSLPEQQKIAHFFTTIDKKLNQLQEKKSHLEQYKKGIMQQLFSVKRLHATSLQKTIRFKQDDGQDFSDWEVKKLGEVCEKQSSNISANTIVNNFGKYKIYGASGYLQNIDFYREEEPYVSIVKDGAGVGRTLLCEAKSSVLGTLDIIKPKGNNNLNFVYSLINQIYFIKYITGSTIPHIYFKDYSKEKLNIPSIQEQTKIANFLSKIDVKINNVNEQIEQTKEWKKGLLQQMFV